MFPEIEEIRRRRKRIGISQKKLAELVGVSQPLIAKLESGKLDPKLSLIKKILAVLDQLEGEARAASIMNSPVIYVSPDDDVRKAIELMLEHGISQLPVLDGSRPVGSVTEDSIVRLILERKFEDLKVADIMGSPFPAISEDSPLSSVVSLLIEFPAVLVVSGDRVVGIITKHDVMRRLTSQTL